MPVLDISGRRYGRLTAIRFSHKEQNRRHVWKCICDCGSDVLVRKENLRSGNTSSCGCWRRDEIAQRSYKHGGSRRGVNKSRLYRVWSTMRDRCSNSKNRSYKDYGARGIFVCARWNDSFENFAFDVGERPSNLHSIDRIDNNGPYAPNNVRWATPLEQRHNQRRCLTESSAPRGEVSAAEAAHASEKRETTCRI